MRIKALYLFASSLLVIAATEAALFSSAEERESDNTGITVYIDSNFLGKNATFNEAMPDLRSSEFNDTISSLKVAPEEKWEVCEYPNYRGRCVVVWGEQSELTYQWSDLISSLRPVKSGTHFSSYKASPNNDLFIVLHDETMFRGSPVLYEGAVANLDTLNRRVQSVVIGEGIWELCEGLSFTGYCIILAESVPDLHQYGMHNRIKSVRPISNFPFEPQVKSDFHIVVFDNMMYRGNSKDYEEAEYNLYEFNKRTQSVKIEKGVWELCEGKHFGGRCITVDKNVPDLKIYNMLNSISSLRPVKPQHN